MIPKGYTMRPQSGIAGLAALSICESILLSLTENKIIDAAEAKAILEDAAAAHREAAQLADDTNHYHAEVATLLELLMMHGNSVRHADRQLQAV
jgi:hypothetical protein